MGKDTIIISNELWISGDFTSLCNSEDVIDVVNWKNVKYISMNKIDFENYTKEKDSSWYDLPSNVVGVLVDPISGEVATENTKKPTMFYYIKGTEPTYIDDSLESLLPTIKIQ